MVASVTASVSSPQTQQVTKAPSPEDAFKQLDTGNKGYLTVTDLESAVVKISDKGANLSKTDATASAKAVFAKMDANSDGKVTTTEFKATADSPPANGVATGAKPPGGAGGAGGHDGPKGGGVGSSTSNTTYAAADTNQDGVVTSMEQEAYNAKHLSATSNTATANSAAASAVKTYESISTAVN